MYCPNCKKEVGKDMRFCPDCGTKTVEQRTCPNCGEPLEEGMLFCPECGQKVEGSAEPQQTAVPEPETKQGSAPEQNLVHRFFTKEPEPEIVQPSGPEPAAKQPSPPPIQPSVTKTASSQKKFPVGVLAGICAGVLVIAIGGFLFLQKNGAEQEQAEPETAQVLEAEEETAAIPEETQAAEEVFAEEAPAAEEPAETEEPEEAPAAEPEPATFEGAKDRTSQQEAVAAGGQLDLQHIGNLLGNTGATYGAYVLDLTNMQEYDCGNADEPLPASALIGVPILFTIAEQVDQGNIDLNTQVPFSYTFENGRGIFKSSDNGRTFPLSQLLAEALMNSDNNALNSLMDFLTLDKINEVCHSYGYTSVDMQRKLVTGSSDLENYISARDAAMMLNAVYQDNFTGNTTGIGGEFLKLNFRISGADTANRGMYPACTGCDMFLNLNGITDTRYNEIGLIQKGGETFILSVFTCNGVGDTSAQALTPLTSYIVDTLKAQ